jgi:hypothetical protein
MMLSSRAGRVESIPTANGDALTSALTGARWTRGSIGVGNTSGAGLVSGGVAAGVQPATATARSANLLSREFKLVVKKRMV